MGSNIIQALSCSMLIAVFTSADDVRRLSMPSETPVEYCESETFKAACFSNEVIVMTSAKYGRMRLGRCVESDLGYLGCHEDILDLVDHKCSGKRECEIRIPDSTLDTTKPCYKELKVYLEASYKCVRVVAKDHGGCTTPINVNPTEGHLLVDLDQSESTCSSWTFDAQPGQHINLTMLDFSWRALKSGPNKGGTTTTIQNCLNYGKALDRYDNKNVTICGGLHDREKHILLSANSTVQIRIPKHGRVMANRRILIRYGAVGCPDLRRPKDAWLKRNQTDATMGCVTTRQTWHLKCNGKNWVGVIGNCTQHLMSARNEAQIEGYHTNIPHSVAIVLIVGIAVIICAVIVSIGFACIRRYNQKLCGKRKGQVRYDNVRTDEDVYKARKDDVVTISQKTEQHVIHSDPSKASPVIKATHKKNDYSHIWEFPLPDPKQDRNNAPDPSYRGMRSSGNTDSAYGTSLLCTRPGNDENYHVSMASRTTDDSRYFVLDRDPCVPIPDDPDC